MKIEYVLAVEAPRLITVFEYAGLNYPLKRERVVEQNPGSEVVDFPDFCLSYNPKKMVEGKLVVSLETMDFQKRYAVIALRLTSHRQLIPLEKAEYLFSSPDRVIWTGAVLERQGRGGYVIYAEQEGDPDFQNQNVSLRQQGSEFYWPEQSERVGSITNLEDGKKYCLVETVRGKIELMEYEIAQQQRVKLQP